MNKFTEVCVENLKQTIVKKAKSPKPSQKDFVRRTSEIGETSEQLRPTRMPTIEPTRIPTRVPILVRPNELKRYSARTDYIIQETLKLFSQEAITILTSDDVGMKALVFVSGMTPMKDWYKNLVLQKGPYYMRRFLDEGIMEIRLEPRTNPLAGPFASPIEGVYIYVAGEPIAKFEMAQTKIVAERCHGLPVIPTVLRDEANQVNFFTDEPTQFSPQLHTITRIGQLIYNIHGPQSVLIQGASSVVGLTIGGAKNLIAKTPVTVATKGIGGTINLVGNTVQLGRRIPLFGGLFGLTGKGIKAVGSGVSSAGNKINESVDNVVAGVTETFLPTKSQETLIRTYIDELKERIVHFETTPKGLTIRAADEVSRTGVLHATYSQVQIPSTPWQSFYVEWGIFLVGVSLGLWLWKHGMQPISKAINTINNILKKKKKFK